MVKECQHGNEARGWYETAMHTKSTKDFAVSALSTFFPHMQVNLVCIEFGNYAQWTANLTTANPLLSLGTIVEGINIAGKIVFSQNLAGPFLG